VADQLENRHNSRRPNTREDDDFPTALVRGDAEHYTADDEAKVVRELSYFQVGLNVAEDFKVGGN